MESRKEVRDGRIQSIREYIKTESRPVSGLLLPESIRLAEHLQVHHSTLFRFGTTVHPGGIMRSVVEGNSDLEWLGQGHVFFDPNQAPPSAAELAYDASQLPLAELENLASSIVDILRERIAEAAKEV